MDESEKRRERLKALRVEAAEQPDVSNDIGFPINSLSNPLIEPSETQSLLQEESRATQRFDFYTDPMAAFSANKKRTHDTEHSTPHYVPPSGATAPDHTHYKMQHQPQGPYSNPAFHGNPRGPTRPFPMYQGTPKAPNMSGGYGVGANIPQPMGGPRFNYGQSRPHWPVNGPDYGQQGPFRPDFGYRGPLRPDFGYRGPLRPDFGYRGPPRPDFRYHDNPSPHHGSFRGSVSWHGGRTSQVSGRGGGRWSDLNNSGPERFYDKSMVEDPWQHLEPVLWKGLYGTSDSLKSSSSSNSWLPKSISEKKTKFSEAYSYYNNNSSVQPSLAEYLSSAFSEATDNSPSG